MKDKVYARCHDCRKITDVKLESISKYFPNEPVIFCCDECIKKRNDDFNRRLDELKKITSKHKNNTIMQDYFNMTALV